MTELPQALPSDELAEDIIETSSLNSFREVLAGLEEALSVAILFSLLFIAAQLGDLHDEFALSRGLL